MDSSHPDIIANVNALVVNESDEMMKDLNNRNNVNIEIVVVTGYHNDRDNEALIRGARRDDKANVLPLCTESSAEIGSAVEIDDASEARRGQSWLFVYRDCARTFRSTLVHG